MVAVDGSTSAHQAFHYALQHSNKDDHIIVVTGMVIRFLANQCEGVRKKYPSITPEIQSDPNKLAHEKERIKEINKKSKEKGKQQLISESLTLIRRRYPQNLSKPMPTS